MTLLWLAWALVAAFGAGWLCGALLEHERRLDAEMQLDDALQRIERLTHRRNSA